MNYFHNNYTNQEIDFETALGVEETSGGNSTYHGVDAFFDADPRSNIHFFFNFAGEASNFTTYVRVARASPAARLRNPARGCVFYNNLPVSYVPNITLNTGVYYGIQHHNRTIVEPRFWVETTGTQYLWSNNGILTADRRPDHPDHAVLHDGESLVQRSHHLRKAVLQPAGRHDESRAIRSTTNTSTSPAAATLRRSPRSQQRPAATSTPIRALHAPSTAPSPINSDCAMNEPGAAEMRRSGFIHGMASM